MTTSFSIHPLKTPLPLRFYHHVFIHMTSLRVSVFHFIMAVRRYTASLMGSYILQHHTQVIAPCILVERPVWFFSRTNPCFTGGFKLFLSMIMQQSLRFGTWSLWKYCESRRTCSVVRVTLFLSFFREWLCVSSLILSFVISDSYIESHFTILLSQAESWKETCVFIERLMDVTLRYISIFICNNIHWGYY